MLPLDHWKLPSEQLDRIFAAVNSSRGFARYRMSRIQES
jgi:hypothetical protein